MSFVVVNDTHFMAKSGSRLEILPALLEKWAWVLSFTKANNSVLLHTGDFFNSAVVPEEVKSTVMSMIKQHGVSVFGIYGNHDLLYNNELYSSKTSLNVLEVGGCFHVVRQEINFNGVSVAPLGVVTSQPAIVLGHAFLDQGSAPTVTSAQLDTYTKPTVIFLGHDHKQYPPAVINLQTPTIVYRNGAFIRQTVDTSKDLPTVSLVTFDGTQFDVQVVTIPCKEAVFITQSSHTIHMDDVEVGALVSSLSSITTESKSLDFYLQGVAPAEVLSYIQNLS